jgi:hypothetical protein
MLRQQLKNSHNRFLYQPVQFTVSYHHHNLLRIQIVSAVTKLIAIFGTKGSWEMRTQLATLSTTARPGSTSIVLRTTVETLTSLDNILSGGTKALVGGGREKTKALRSTTGVKF